MTLTAPPDTSAALEKAGWRFDHYEPVMVRALDPDASLPTMRADVTVEEVTAATLAEWSRVVAVSFGCPQEYVEGPASYDRDVGLPGETPLRRFLLRVDGEPVASSALLPGPPASRLAGIFSVATLEPARGRGFGTIVTQAAMAAARTTGTRVVVLQASDMGRRVYERLGFDTVAALTVHVPSAG